MLGAAGHPRPGTCTEGSPGPRGPPNPPRGFLALSVHPPMSAGVWEGPEHPPPRATWLGNDRARPSVQLPAL